MSITQAELRRCLHYEPDSGIFTWINVSKYHCQLEGKVAGTLRLSRGKYYRWIGLNKKQYPTHRLAWFYCYNKWPNVIDHMNGNSLDNRLCNLNDVDVYKNTQNHRVKIKPNGLPTGVRISKNGKYVARIKINGNPIHIGTYATIPDAAQAYRIARIKHHYCPAEKLSENL